MFDPAALSLAVEKGIISPEQKEQLLALLSEQRSSNSVAARDEAPRFFRSFNDLFIGLGIFILGWALTTGSFLVADEFPPLRIFVMLASTLLIWWLAEWITRVRRINFPSIIIACFFGLFSLFTLFAGWDLIAGTPDGKPTSLFSESPLPSFVVFGFGSLAMAAFFWRFRLPFSVLLLAAFLMMTLISGLFAVFGKDTLEPVLRWIFLLAGLLVFAGAMKFDFQDPLRTQRTSDHGFWLHLLAAPIITHSVLWTTLKPILSKTADAEASANVMVLVVLVMFAVFSLVALIIDRRALLISSLGYASAALGYIIYKFSIEGTLALVLTLGLIAVLILTLGTGWYQLRAKVFQFLPDFAFKDKLPPLKL